MAKQNPSSQPAPSGSALGNAVQEIQEAVFTANHGLSKSFITKNEDIVKRSNKAVADTLTGFGITTLNSGRNSIQELAQLVQSSVRYKPSNIRATDGVFDFEDQSGIRTLTPMGNIDQAEQEVITQNAMLYQSFLSITTEYRGVVTIIPELQHAIQNIVRDILNTSELSKRFFNKLYSDKHHKYAAMDMAGKNAIDRCNELLQTEIVDKNKLEIKFERWIYESVISGVKPVAFIPYDYIIRQLNALNAAGDIVDVGKVGNALKAGESCSIVKSESDLSTLYARSVESSVEDMIRDDPMVKRGEKTVELSVESAFDDIIDDSLTDAYIDAFDSAFAKECAMAYEKEKSIADRIERNSFLGRENSNAIEELDLIKDVTKNYEEKKKQMSAMTHDDKVKAAREGLKTLAKFIDSNVDVVKPTASSAFIASRVLQEKDRYKKFYDLGKDYKIPDSLVTSGYTKVKENERDTFDDASSIGKECLIVPYSPESIIPINVNGEYMGFYCLEYEHLMGPLWKNRQKTGSFTDYVQQQGYGSDKNLMGGTTTMMAHGGTDPLENNLYTPSSVYNYSASQYLQGNMDQQDQRFDMMKTVAMKVLAHRLHDPDLVDNKVFKDAVMHLLRNDVLMRKKVQFTFIPPEYMCYMTYKTDDDGLPISILDGTLFFCYLYISSVVASGMIKLLKSSDKEKYEIDVGLQKNIGYSVDEIQRCLSTRTLYTQSMFSSLSSVVKNAGSYQRLIIPVIKDKKLYDVTQIEHMNNLDPDDQFTDKILKQVLNKIYINAGASEEFNTVDFAKQLSMRNLEYRNNIVKAQANYEPYATKAIRLLTKYSSLKTYNSEAETLNRTAIKETEEQRAQMIDLSCINVTLTPPTYLTMTNIIESLNTAKDMASSILEIYGFSAGGGSGISDAQADIFKRKIVMKYADCIQFDELDALLAEAEDEAASKVVGKGKDAKKDEAIQTQMSGTDTGMGGGMSDPSGGGFDDGTGGDMGGGDDFGGGDAGGMPSI